MEENDVKIVEPVDSDKPKKITPTLSEEVKKIRELQKKKPSFIRQQFWQFKRLADTWRRPRGRHSKQRRHYKYRTPVVRIGYRSPKKLRGLHPSGFIEKMVYNSKNLENIDTKTQAIRIGGTVGKKKRKEIIAKADELGLRVLNRGI
jgi:large subunit ribosomal protein L32e